MHLGEVCGDLPAYYQAKEGHMRIHIHKERDGHSRVVLQPARQSGKGPTTLRGLTRQALGPAVSAAAAVLKSRVRPLVDDPSH